MLAVILFGIAAFLVFVGGLTVFIIMLVKKVKWWGSCLVLVGTLFLVGILTVAAVGFLIYEKSEDEINSAKDFWGDLGKIQEEAGKVSEELEELENLDTNEWTNTSTSTNTSDNTNTSDSSSSTSTTKDDDYYTDLGMIKNNDYHYIITVGKDHAKKITPQKADKLEGITDAYNYCYQTLDSGYGGYECPANSVAVFSIYVYSESQWADVKDSPFLGSLMGQDGGYYFVLSHPNGIMPSDVPTTDEFYDSVVYSIDFAD